MKAETKTSLEFNFVLGKLKHAITRQRINKKQLLGEVTA